MIPRENPENPDRGSFLSDPDPGMFFQRIPTEGHFCEAWQGSRPRVVFVRPGEVAKRGGRLTFLAARAVIGASAESTSRP